jgi:hypothetical protein
MSTVTRPHRLQTQRKRFTPSSPVVAKPQSYLLFFRDIDERFIVKKTSIEKMDSDYATVVIGAKHRQAENEAQGIDHRPLLSLNDRFSHLKVHSQCAKTCSTTRRTRSANKVERNEHMRSIPFHVFHVVDTRPRQRVTDESDGESNIDRSDANFVKKEVLFSL